MLSSKNFRTVLLFLNKRILPQARTSVASRSLSTLSQRPLETVHGGRNTKVLFVSQGSPLHKRFFADYPSHVILKLPNLSPTMTTGSVVSWAKGEGDQIEEGDLLAEIETDKATMALDASDNGYMAKILAPEGTRDIPVGTALCVVVEDAGDVAAFSDFVAPTAAAAAAPPAASPPPPAAAPPPPAPAAAAAPPPPPAAAPAAAGARVFASPLAKTLAADKGVNLATIGGGSGPDGRIRAQDVQAFVDSGAVSAPAAAPAPAAPAAPVPGIEAFVDVPLSNMRAVIAKRLTASKQTIPHYYLTIDIRMDTTIELRAKLNERLKAKKIEKKLSVNDFLIKAAAVACQKVPECNSSWQDTFIRQYNQVDVSVAVATEGGLITPIVASAEKRGLLEISETVAELAGKARAGKLQPHEFIGGTFTISNLGMFGIKNFTAIINPPQACILAVGGVEKRLVPGGEDGSSVATVMSVTLCCDHRVVDGAVGAQWLQHFKQHLEEPMSMLL